MNARTIKRVSYQCLLCLFVALAILLFFFGSPGKAEPLKITPEVVKAGIGPRSCAEYAINQIVGIAYDVIGKSGRELPFEKTMEAKIAIRFFNAKAQWLLPADYVKLLPKTNSFFSSNRAALINLKEIEYYLESQVAHFVSFTEEEANLDPGAKRKRIQQMRMLLERLSLEDP